MYWTFALQEFTVPAQWIISGALEVDVEWIDI